MSISGFCKIVTAKPHKRECRQQEELNTLNLWIHDKNNKDASHLIDSLSVDSLNCSDSFFKKNPLHIAIIKEDIDTINKLLSRGVDLEVKNYHGLDAYYYAVQVVNIQIMSMLYKNNSKLCYFCPIL